MTLDADRAGSHPLGERIALVLAFLAMVPGLAIRFADVDLAHPVEAVMIAVLRSRYLFSIALM